MAVFSRRSTLHGMALIGLFVGIVAGWFAHLYAHAGSDAVMNARRVLDIRHALDQTYSTQLELREQLCIVMHGERENLQQLVDDGLFPSDRNISEQVLRDTMKIPECGDWQELKGRND